MKNCRLYFLAIALVFSTLARANDLDDALKRLRAGAPWDEAALKALVGRECDKLWEQNKASPADLYLLQIKLSILDPSEHGGWPYRSELVIHADTRAVLVRELRRRFEGSHSALIAFALICPSLYAQDDAGVGHYIAVVEKDPFLAAQLHAKLDSRWRPFIRNALGQISAVTTEYGRAIDGVTTADGYQTYKVGGDRQDHYLITDPGQVGKLVQSLVAVTPISESVGDTQNYDDVVICKAGKPVFSVAFIHEPYGGSPCQLVIRRAGSPARIFTVDEHSFSTVQQSVVMVTVARTVTD